MWGKHNAIVLGADRTPARSTTARRVPPAQAAPPGGRGTGLLPYRRELLADRLGAQARLANDATVQGLGVIAGHGLECVITLGTGMGFALFEDGRPGPHLELSQHPVRGRKTYDQYVGNASLHEVGRKRWNRRVRKAIGFIATLTSFDMLYIGGGNSRNVQGDLPEKVRIVSNEAGITGGIRLWDAHLDAMFVAV